MNTVFGNQDLLACLLVHFNIEDIENLYLCNSILRSIIRNSKTVKNLAKLFNIDKDLDSYYLLLIEYNHRYRREKSFDNDILYHIRWAIKEGDISTLINTLEEYKRSKNHAYEYFYFEAGMKNNEFMLEILDNKYKQITNKNHSIYIAGKASSVQIEEIDDNILSNIKEKDISFITFEAIRGNNKTLVKKLIELLKTRPKGRSYITRILVFGAVATNNIKDLSIIFKNLALYPDNDWTSVSIGLIDIYIDGLINKFLYSCNADVKITKHHIYDILMVMALHYKNYDIFEYLLEDMNINPNICFCVMNPDSYNVVKGKLPSGISIDHYAPDLLRISSCKNNLSMVKELKEWINPKKLPIYFTEMITNNSYKVIIWMLETYKFSISAVKNILKHFKFTSNYSSKIVHSYIERRKIK
jgi:hypothetical protein